MHEIDLIPQEYKSWMFFTRKIKLFVFFMLGVLALVVSGFVYVQQLTEERTLQVQALQERKAISSKQRDELRELDRRKKALQQQLSLLTGLRGGATVSEMFLTVDRVLEENQVWFLNWKYRRAGSVISPEQQAIETGYFLVVPRSEGAARTEAWKIRTHMAIAGQAVDHSALSAFVSRLINQPEIQDVHVLNTTVRQRSEVKVVDFNLAVTVSGEGGRT